MRAAEVVRVRAYDEPGPRHSTAWGLLQKWRDELVEEAYEAEFAPLRGVGRPVQQ